MANAVNRAEASADPLQGRRRECQRRRKQLMARAIKVYGKEGSWPDWTPNIEPDDQPMPAKEVACLDRAGDDVVGGRSLSGGGGARRHILIDEAAEMTREDFARLILRANDSYIVSHGHEHIVTCNGQRHTATTVFGETIDHGPCDCKR